ncbi:unnamed protein product [Jaminaea pallidilutea]
MARLKKKGESGAAKNFVTRNQALKKLQISLSDFRRLCILKGIHPQQPRSTKKANKGSSAPATFYYAKDIAYLAHEPILRSLRDHKAFAKKLSRAIGRREWAAAKNLEESKPQYTLDHIIKQRYPTFDEALGDIDDALCMVALFANLPAKMYNLPEGVVDTCGRLKREWDEYIVRTKTLHKTFLSIKGVYFQATIRGKDITWLVPYPFTQHVPADVDFRVMSTFLELYTTLVSFVLYKLWSDLGQAYPPKLDEAKVASSSKSTPSTGQDTAANGAGISRKTVRKAVRAAEQGQDAGAVEAGQDVADEQEAQGGADADDAPAAEFTASSSRPGVDTLPVPSAANTSQAANLFRNCTLYLDRSTPLSLLSFILRSYGSLTTRIGWDDILAPDSPIKEDDSRITHVIIDRPELPESSKRAGRRYVQPQWVVDSANKATLMPEDKYDVGKTLPPHMSPFVEGEVVDEEMGADEALGAVDEEELDASDADEEEDEEEEETDAATRPALAALLAASDDPDAAQDQGLVDAAELEAESMGGEAEMERVRNLWSKATGGATGLSTSAVTAAAAAPTSSGPVSKTDGAQVAEDDEARKMARGLLSNRQRKLYDKLSYTKTKKEEDKARLASRRQEIKDEEKRKQRGKAAN